ncbi:DUF1450 domain-containing protein [Peribacillus sp. NPDC096540]|uniref:DUF1450 domain-containing protein n=1 Tax=Peribacillus sp. NPDC096540 TaxID=3390612 RepID=UPI003D059C0F
MGIVIVEVCDMSLLSSSELENILETHPEVTVMRYECMDICNLCKMRPYALVNGKKIYAKSTEECIELIKNEVEKELFLYM